MRYTIRDEKNNFIYAFDSETGAYARTGVLDENNHDTGVDPFMSSFPHLIDVGVMGHCIHGKTGLCKKAGIECYQSGSLIDKPNMSVDNFRWIAMQCKGRTNQFALGGRGDPDQHEHFEELLKISRDNYIVPNFTTSGYGMTKQIADICKKYCGAVAVSWYRSAYTISAIELLLAAKVKTNIHYVLGNNSIDEAIQRLETDNFPKGINAVIFLLHKPAGQGTAANVIKIGDPRVARFFELFDKPHAFKVGMDSCSVPGAISFCKNIFPASLDTCEAGRFSCYIGADMSMVPCSFDQDGKYKISLIDESGNIINSIEDAWNSVKFNDVRHIMQLSCPECLIREQCMGGCPIMTEIVLCDRCR